MEAIRYNEGKRKWSLVNYKALEPMVEALEFGAKKYPPHNYRKGLPVTETVESALRHIFAFMEGEDHDSESGLHHLGHAMSNIMMTIGNLQDKPQLDDRFIHSVDNSTPDAGDSTAVRQDSKNKTKPNVCDRCGFEHDTDDLCLSSGVDVPVVGIFDTPAMHYYLSEIENIFPKGYWAFIEAFHPNYYHNDEVLWADDMLKKLEIGDGTIELAKELVQLEVKLFTEAMNNKDNKQ